MRRRSYEDAVAGEERLREREGELIKLLLTRDLACQKLYYRTRLGQAEEGLHHGRGHGQKTSEARQRRGICLQQDEQVLASSPLYTGIYS